MVSDFTTPRVAMFTRAGERSEVVTAAFNFLRVAGAFSHEAVCNAIMALEHEELPVLLAAASFLAAASALCSSNDRRPAITALQGTNATLNCCLHL